MPSILKTNALISVAELNAFLQQTITAGLDEQLINYASQIIETLCNRKFMSQAYVREKYNIEAPTHYLYLKNPPISAITGIYEYDTMTDSLIYTYVKDQDYVEYLTDGYVYLHAKLPKCSGRIQVSYTGGFTEAPYDLKMVCAQIAGLIFNTKGIAGVDSERIGNYAITYSKSSVGIDGLGFPVPIELFNILMSYRRGNI